MNAGTRSGPARPVASLALVALILLGALLACVGTVLRRGPGDLAQAHGTDQPMLSLHPGRPRDSLPPIDRPEFAPSAPGVGFLAEDDWVIGIRHQGRVRAYPLWIVAQREIVNDQIGTDPICITFCPLSATASAFVSRVGGRARSFRNDGRLHECNLVLFDSESDSLWYQLGGISIRGSCRGEVLEGVPSPIVRWADWRKRHPQCEVLVGSASGGRFHRALSSGPPPSRFAASAPFAPVSRADPRLPEMLPVTGFRYAGKAACVPLDLLPRLSPDGISIPQLAATVTLFPADGVARLRTAMGEVEVPLVEGYWFAWSAAHPDAVLIQLPGPPGATDPHRPGP